LFREFFLSRLATTVMARNNKTFIPLQRCFNNGIVRQFFDFLAPPPLQFEVRVFAIDFADQFVFAEFHSAHSFLISSYPSPCRLDCIFSHAILRINFAVEFHGADSFLRSSYTSPVVPFFTAARDVTRIAGGGARYSVVQASDDHDCVRGRASQDGSRKPGPARACLIK
jgi:hypothetical protein